MYFICCYSITNTVISLIAHKLHWIHMKSQEKFKTQSSKLKVHRANLQTISLYPVRFYRYSLFFYSFLCLLFSCFFCFKKLKIHILIYIQLWGQVSGKKNSHPANFQKQGNFFLAGKNVTWLVQTFQRRSFTL